MLGTGAYRVTAANECLVGQGRISRPRHFRPRPAKRARPATRGPIRRKLRLWRRERSEILKGLKMTVITNGQSGKTHPASVDHCSDASKSPHPDVAWEAPPAPQAGGACEILQPDRRWPKLG